MLDQRCALRTSDSVAPASWVLGRGMLMSQTLAGVFEKMPDKEKKEQIKKVSTLESLKLERGSGVELELTDLDQRHVSVECQEQRRQRSYLGVSRSIIGFERKGEKERVRDRDGSDLTA